MPLFTNGAYLKCIIFLLVENFFLKFIETLKPAKYNSIKENKQTNPSLPLIITNDILEQ